MKKFLFITALVSVLSGCNAPKMNSGDDVPRINPPLVTGTLPGTPFLFAIPTQGMRPVEWTAEGLPDGIRLDSSTGILSGNVTEAGVYDVRITAKNKFGKTESTLTIKIGRISGLYTADGVEQLEYL